jgi:hypothetical protein
MEIGNCAEDIVKIKSKINHSNEIDNEYFGSTVEQIKWVASPNNLSEYQT